MGNLALNLFFMFRVFLSFASRIYDFFFLPLEDYPVDLIGVEVIDDVLHLFLALVSSVAPGITLFGLMFDTGVTFLVLWTLFNWARSGLVTT
jgi:hypothetical protein